MAIFGSVATLSKQVENKHFAKVFDFLKNENLEELFAQVQTDKPLTIKLDGDDVFAILQENITRMPEAKCKFEGHRKYIDLQYVHAGRECICVSDISQMADVSVPYSTEKDIFFCSAKTQSSLDLASGCAAIFWPDDLHAPCLSHGEPEAVKKIVFKIKTY